MTIKCYFYLTFFYKKCYFNITHIYKHIIQEGIGLRQIIDYYFVLKQGFTEEERVHDERLLRHLGLYKVASALMWVLKETLGLDEKYWLVAPNEKVAMHPFIGCWICQSSHRVWPPRYR